MKVAYHRNDNIRFRRDAKVKSEQRWPKVLYMRSPPVCASHWKLIAETFRTGFQIFIKFASLDFSGTTIQQSDLTFSLIGAYIVLSLNC